MCCPAKGHSDSAARGTSPPESALWGCCWHNSRQTVINPDYSMTKQLCTKCIYDKIHSKSNRTTLPTCVLCNVTHISLTTGVAALHIPSWRVREREERRQAPTESLFYSHFLPCSKFEKKGTYEDNGQFQFCVNLLPRSTPRIKHWNQRRFVGAVFTIPLGKMGTKVTMVTELIVRWHWRML